MPSPIDIVDAFTNRPFSGNPAAICLLDRDASDEWRQNLAAEMNLSETAYVRPLEHGFELRWFTPGIEVDLCGHATLAAAHAVWRRELVSDEQPIEFHTRSGVLTCIRRGDWIEVDFPATDPESCEIPAGLFEALEIDCATNVMRSKFDYLLELESCRAVEQISPDFRKLKEIDVRGIIVTARTREQAEFDFVSRFFAPRCGVDEDPVCGSAHCTLGPYWGRKLDKSILTGHQISQRGGVVRISLVDGRVFLQGQATTVVTGELSSSADPG